MKLLKKYLLAFAIMLLSGAVYGQQDPMYSMYLNNALIVNPAYAGSRDALSISLLSRLQWIGMDGAPNTSTVSIHGPSRNRRHGFGVSLMNDQITYYNRSLINLDYAYRIPVGKVSTFSMGLNASGYYQRINWSKAKMGDLTDQVKEAYGVSQFLPNAGLGFYFDAKKWYVGLSLPRLLDNAFRKSLFDQGGAEIEMGKLVRHYYMTAGMVVGISEKIKFKPSTLMKYTQGSNVQFDLNATFFFNDFIAITASYRTGDGIVGMFQIRPIKNVWFSYAYDYPFTKLSTLTSGSHEFALGFDLSKKVKKYNSPRYY